MMKYLIVRTTVDASGPPGATDLGDGTWGRWIDPAIGRAWVDAKKGRTLLAILDLGDDLLPDVGLLDRMTDLSATDLVSLTDEQLDLVAAGLFRSSTRWSTAAVTAVRAEYDRRGLVV